MKPSAERHMRGSVPCWQPDTRAPAEPARRGAAAWLSFHPNLPRTGTWGGGTWAPSCPPPPACAGTRGGERKTCLKLAAGHASPVLADGVLGIPAGPLPPHLGWVHPNPLANCRWVGFFPPPLPGGLAVTPLQLRRGCLAFRHHLWGWSQHGGGAGWGKSLPSPWQGRAAPASGSPHPAHPVLGGVRRPARLLLANLFPLRLPPSLTARSVAGRDPAAEEQTREGGEGA